MSNIETPSGTEPVNLAAFGLVPTGEPDPSEAELDAAIQSAFNNRPQGDGNQLPPDPEDDEEEDEGTPPDSTVTQGATTELPPGQEGGEETPSVATGGDDLAALLTLRLGRTPTAAEINSIVDIANWASSLTPEQIAIIEGRVPQQGVIAEPTPDPLEEQYGDDPLYQRLRQLEAEHAQLAQERVVQQQQRYVGEIERATNDFRSQVNLDDEAFDKFQGAVIQAGILPAMLQVHGGDAYQATVAAYESIFWRTPEYRDAEMATRLAGLSQQQQQHTQRQRKAASVSGTGGNGASRTEAPKPATNDDRWAALAAGIREAQNNGTP